MRHELTLQEHERLVAGLRVWLDARHGAGATQVVTTHISSVLLAGSWAYKLKKPVRLPFLDFSTLARRRFYCDEELRINRRTAPGLYVDVLPVRGGLDAPCLSDEGGERQAQGDDPGLDWVLRMRRFDDGRLFQTLARQGRLEPGHMEALAGHVAQFHQGLPALQVDEAPSKDVADWCEASLAELVPLSVTESGRTERNSNSKPGWLADLPRVAQALRAQLAELVGWRAGRVRDGWLRECHGDLHLGNIVLWQGEVMAFDAIEFDPALRRIDVVNDAAFAFMDLQAEGHPALAWHFINAYVERTGDFDGLRGLPVYAAYRALVRAKVALLTGGAEAQEAFARYWGQVLRWAGVTGKGMGTEAGWPRGPWLVVVAGLSGSGKTTVARALSERLGAVHLRSDVERKRLYGMGPTDRPMAAGECDPKGVAVTELYGPEATRRTYERLVALAAPLLEAGLNVVLDAVYARQAERDAVHAAAQTVGAGFLLLECVAPVPVMRERMAQRRLMNTDASDATADVLALQQAHWEPLPPAWDAWHRVLRNDAEPKDLVSQLRPEWLMPGT